MSWVGEGLRARLTTPRTIVEETHRMAKEKLEKGRRHSPRRPGARTCARRRADGNQEDNPDDRSRTRHRRQRRLRGLAGLRAGGCGAAMITRDMAVGDAAMVRPTTYDDNARTVDRCGRPAPG